MQGKGVVIFFLVLLSLVCVYQLSFTVVAQRIEKEVEAYALELVEEGTPHREAALAQARRARKQALQAEEVYNLGFAKFTYEQVLDRQFNRGLDLKGGINVILQISVDSILLELAKQSKDTVFRKAIGQANEAMKTSGGTAYVELFFQEFDRLSEGGKTRLSDPDIFGHRELASEINYQMLDQEVKAVIRDKVDEAITGAFEVLRKRIDRFGVAQPNIQRLGRSGRILVELPGAEDISRVKSLLKSTARLEFWETYKNQDFSNFLTEVNEYLKRKDK